MFTKRTIAIFSLALSFQLVFAENEAEYRSYIEEHTHLAIKYAQQSGIPASICLAMALLESGAGNSTLATEAQNHFGIKADTTRWKGEVVYRKDDERDANGNLVPSAFRKYKSVEDSYADYVKVIKSGKRYAHLFRIEASDYNGWALGLQVAGYATSVKYADNVINIIERYELYKHDGVAKIEPIVASRKQAEIHMIAQYTPNQPKQGAQATKINQQTTNDGHILPIAAIKRPELTAPETETQEEDTAEIYDLVPQSTQPEVPTPTQRLAPMKARPTNRPAPIREN